jgi:hypothetical protein
MENYKLSQTEIDALYRFCIKHGVKYYDVQVELVDHLATAIETEIATNHNTTFEESLQKEYKSFGITGFSKLISERKAAIEKGIKKKRIEILKKSITPPLLFVTIAILFLPIYFIYNKDIASMKRLNTFYFFLDITIAIYWVTQTTIHKRQRNKTDSSKRVKIMMEDIPKVWQAFFLFLTLSNSLQGWGQFVSYSKGNSDFFLIAGWLLINTLSSFILVNFIKENRKLHQYTRKQYPDAFIA